MSGTHARPDLARYRDKVTVLIKEGATFGAVEAVIGAQAELTEDEKGALWLFALSLRDRAEGQSDPRPDLAGVQVAAGTAGATDYARPREFDANGFPMPQPNRSFLERVTGLLNPQ